MDVAMPRARRVQSIRNGRAHRSFLGAGKFRCEVPPHQVIHTRAGKTVYSFLCQLPDHLNYTLSMLNPFRGLQLLFGPLPFGEWDTA